MISFNSYLELYSPWSLGFIVSRKSKGETL